ncbi:hypothetical protein M0805_004755 [Coniferiporia weirii]|nr:hypothetical protein M0805_004755 [Coniferiporia weirii]
MSQRRKSQSPTVNNRDSVPPAPVLSFYQESGQSYRPFTDPKRIETNDAKKNNGMDPRVHVKGVPAKFLSVMEGVMDTAETPIASSAHTIESQPQCEPPQMVFNSGCQQGTISLNVDSSLFINDGAVHLSPAPLHVDIPSSNSAGSYMESPFGTLDTMLHSSSAYNESQMQLLGHTLMASLDSSCFANPIQPDFSILEGTYPMERGLSPLYSPETSPSDSSDLSFESFNNLTMPELFDSGLFEERHSLGENSSSQTSLVLSHKPSYVSSYGSETNLEMSNYPDSNGFHPPDMNIDLGCSEFFPKSSEAGFLNYEDQMSQFRSNFDSNFDYQPLYSSSEDPVVYAGQYVNILPGIAVCSDLLPQTYTMLAHGSPNM